jgi:CheY-like chemotaxis protein
MREERYGLKWNHHFDDEILSTMDRSEDHRYLQVLHVDDDPAMLDIISCLIIEITDHLSIPTSRSIEGAMNLLRNEEFDAIVSDYQMPIIDGAMFSSSLRSKGDSFFSPGKGSEEV